MFAPGPVKTFLRHPKRNDDVHLARVFDPAKIVQHIRPHRVIGHQISDKDDFAGMSLDLIDASVRIPAQHGSDDIHNFVDLIKLHPRRFH